STCDRAKYSLRLFLRAAILTPHVHSSRNNSELRVLGLCFVEMLSRPNGRVELWHYLFPVLSLSTGSARTTSSGQFAKEEFLGQIGADAFSRANRKIPEHNSGTTIRLGIIKIRYGG